MAAAPRLASSGDAPSCTARASATLRDRPGCRQKMGGVKISTGCGSLFTNVGLFTSAPSILTTLSFRADMVYTWVCFVRSVVPEIHSTTGHCFVGVRLYNAHRCLAVLIHYALRLHRRESILLQVLHARPGACECDRPQLERNSDSITSLHWTRNSLQHLNTHPSHPTPPGGALIRPTVSGYGSNIIASTPQRQQITDILLPDTLWYYTPRNQCDSLQSYLPSSASDSKHFTALGCSLTVQIHPVQRVDCPRL